MFGSKSKKSKLVSKIISDGYPKTKEIMKKHGFDVTVVDMEHIRAADGSLTCLRIFYG